MELFHLFEEIHTTMFFACLFFFLVIGAYVAVADCGCPVTEGGRLDSKLREVLERGTCFEVTATRMEDGVVRGLVAWGGFVR